MEDVFKIFIYRLEDGEESLIEEEVCPDFMEIDEPDLSFRAPVFLKGEASISKGTLVLHLSIQTEATMPCAVCNQDTKIKIFIRDFYHSEELANIRSGIFNFKDLVRESLLLEVPQRTECNEGSCPERTNMAKYLKQNKQSETQEGMTNPFADL